MMQIKKCIKFPVYIFYNSYIISNIIFYSFKLFLFNYEIYFNQNKAKRMKKIIVFSNKPSIIYFILFDSLIK